MKRGLFLPTTNVVDHHIFHGSSQKVGVPYFKDSLAGNDEFHLRVYVPLNSESLFIDIDRFVKSKTHFHEQDDFKQQVRCYLAPEAGLS